MDISTKHSCNYGSVNVVEEMDRKILRARISGVWCETVSTNDIRSYTKGLIKY